MKLFFLSLAISISFSCYAQQAGPVVTTRYGSLQGINEGEVSVFKGIPFAAPPVGENRCGIAI